VEGEEGVGGGGERGGGLRGLVWGCSGLCGGPCEVSSCGTQPSLGGVVFDWRECRGGLSAGQGGRSQGPLGGQDPGFVALLVRFVVGPVVGWLVAR